MVKRSKHEASSTEIDLMTGVVTRHYDLNSSYPSVLTGFSKVEKVQEQISDLAKRHLVAKIAGEYSDTDSVYVPEVCVANGWELVNFSRYHRDSYEIGVFLYERALPRRPPERRKVIRTFDWLNNPKNSGLPEYREDGAFASYGRVGYAP